MTQHPAAPPAGHPPAFPDRLADLPSWDDVSDVLREEWLAVHDGRDRCLVRVRDGLGLVERPRLLRARERRGLHRLGYRLQRAGDLRLWVWLLPDDPPPDQGLDLAASLRRWDLRGRLLREQAVRTVRDVLGADVEAVSVDLLPQEDEDEDCWCGAASDCGGGAW